MLGESLELQKEVKPPVVFDGERGMPLEPIQGIRSSSHGERGNLLVFLELHWEPGVSSQVMTGMFFKYSCFLSDIETPV